MRLLIVNNWDYFIQFIHLMFSLFLCQTYTAEYQIKKILPSDIFTHLNSSNVNSYDCSLTVMTLWLACSLGSFPITVLCEFKKRIDQLVHKLTGTLGVSSLCSFSRHCKGDHRARFSIICSSMSKTTVCQTESVKQVNKSMLWMQTHAPFNTNHIIHHSALSPVRILRRVRHQAFPDLPSRP